MDFTADRIKHLELIQAVVSRLAGDSASMKRYCIVVVAAGAAVYKTFNDTNIIVAVALLVIVFWSLDARYLSTERWYRFLYDEVRKEGSETIPDFRLTISKDIRATGGLWSAMVRWSTLTLYLPLLLLLALLWGSL